MKKLGKTLILCVAVMAIVYCGLVLISQDSQTKVFLAQSVVDNAIFCGMFLIVAWVTGVSC